MLCCIDRLSIACANNNSQKYRITRESLEDRLNTVTTAFQDNSQTAINNKGQIVIVWVSLDTDDRNGDGEPDGEGSDVILQRYLWDEGNGILQKIGDEIVVNSFIRNTQPSADIALDDQGNFVVVWYSDHENAKSSVFAKRFRWTDDFFAALDEEEFRVNSIRKRIYIALV